MVSGRVLCWEREDVRFDLGRRMALALVLALVPTALMLVPLLPLLGPLVPGPLAPALGPLLPLALKLGPLVPLVPLLGPLALAPLELGPYSYGAGVGVMLRLICTGEMVVDGSFFMPYLAGPGPLDIGPGPGPRLGPLGPAPGPLACDGGE